jgi:hypothetical protein
MQLDPQMGFRLHQVFQDAGLPAPEMWVHAAVGGAPDWPGWQLLAQQVRLYVVTLGAEVPDGLSPSEFAEQVRAELVQQQGVLRLQRGVQAWSRKPA